MNNPLIYIYTMRYTIHTQKNLEPPVVINLLPENFDIYFEQLMIAKIRGELEAMIEVNNNKLFY